MTRQDLPNLLYTTIKSLGGSAKMQVIFKKFWNIYSKELEKSGELFYTWNYDIRWAATKLRNEKKMKPAFKKENSRGADVSPQGIWEIL